MPVVRPEPHRIYNMFSDQSDFDIAGYYFSRVNDYAAAEERRHVQAQATHNFATRRYQLTRDESPGTPIHTYNATWIGEGAEGSGVVNLPETAGIHDICLLWSLWGDSYAVTGPRAAYESPIFYGSKLIKTAQGMKGAIEAFLPAVGSHEAARSSRLRLYPGAFLLLESYRQIMAPFPLFFISPCVDLVASGSPVPDPPPKDGVRLGELRRRLVAVVDELQADDDFTRNVLQPLRGDLAGAGGPRAADKLVAFLRSTPALASLNVPHDVLERFARAFNQARNAALHKADFPERLTLSFTQRDPVAIRRPGDFRKVVMAAIHLAYVFRDILQLHFWRAANAGRNDWIEEPSQNTVEAFFRTGIYNGVDWLETDLHAELTRP